jgi:hypothetical protein
MILNGFYCCMFPAVRTRISGRQNTSQKYFRLFSGRQCNEDFTRDRMMLGSQRQFALQVHDEGFRTRECCNERGFLTGFGAPPVVYGCGLSS